MRLAIVAAILASTAAACGAPAPVSPPPPSAPATSASGGSAVEPWPAPPNPMELAVQAGLKPQPREFMTNHVHAHLDVFVDGKPIVVPAGIGIKVDDPATESGDMPDGSKRYGLGQLCNDPCISPLHTHGTDGFLHTESPTPEPNTLGEFFTEWGVILDGSCVATYCSPATKVAIYVDGQLATGDPRAIQLTNQREIAIVIGTPPAQIPSTADFSNA